jgi:arylsulfatase A-like enzyme
LRFVVSNEGNFVSSTPMKKLLLTAALGCASLASAQTPSQTPSRPNIVFIFSDDHAYQALSAYGDARKLINTPNIDRIAKEGMRFDRCLVTNSICGPSRAAILTGKYSHRNGFYNNTNSRFDGAQTTFPKLLQAAGYQTALIGKWHLESDPTGFDYWQILPGQGVYYNPPMIRMGERVKIPGYVTDIITDESLAWLQKRDKTKPFLLMTQHKAPHREWMPALRDLNFDNDRKYPEPPTLFDDYSGRGIAARDQDMTIEKTMVPNDLKLVPSAQLTPEQRKEWDAYYEPRNEAFRKANLSGKDLVRWRYQRYMHDYLGCIKGVDDNVGRLLKYLDEQGLSQNTIVIYSSDQGFFLGEHGWFDKRWIYEESLRTPLLVRWPGVTKAGGVNKNLVSNLDFAETFLDAAGVPIPAEMQGRSFVPILKGQTPKDWRQSFYYHYYEFPAPHRVRPHYGVVTDRYKLVRFYGTGEDYWELFDLKNDPQELRSVYGTRGYERAQSNLLKELNRLRAELQVPENDPPQAYGNRPIKP